MSSSRHSGTPGIDLQKGSSPGYDSEFFVVSGEMGSAANPTQISTIVECQNLLMTLFARKSASVPITKNSADYFPGDVVAWELDNKLLHIGLVTDAVADDTQNYLVVHNIGAGARLEGRADGLEDNRSL